MQLGHLSRVRLASLPTPLQEVPNLSKALNGPRILFKREDMTGDIGIHGNKIRKLEFLLGDAKEKGATIVITAGANQSNHARATVAAARRLGMQAVVVIEEDKPDRFTGNVLLDVVMGAKIRYLTKEEKAELASLRSKGKIFWKKGFDELLEKIGIQLKEAGEKPYVVPAGACNALGSMGYFNAFFELVDQLNDMGVKADCICLGTGGGSTIAGMMLAKKVCGSDIDIVGIATSPGKKSLQEFLAANTNEAAAYLNYNIRTQPEDFEIYDEYVGEGYGIETKAGIEAIRLLARTEGIITGPVYAGKAAAGVINLIKKGRFGKNDTIVFIHTGGASEIFADRFEKTITSDVELLEA